MSAVRRDHVRPGSNSRIKAIGSVTDAAERELEAPLGSSLRPSRRALRGVHQLFSGGCYHLHGLGKQLLPQPHQQPIVSFSFFPSFKIFFFLI